MDYTIVTALFMDGDEYNRCTGCGKMTTESELSSGRCDTCSSPAPAKELSMAAALDMDEIAEKVAGELVANVEAALSWDDAWGKIKTKLGLSKKPPPS